MANILILLNTLTMGGAETQTVQLANGLNGKGHTVKILSMDARNQLSERISPDIEASSLQKRNAIDLASLRSLVRQIKSFQPDILLSVNPYSTMYAVMSRFFLKKSQKPKIVSVQHTTQLETRMDRMRQSFDSIFIRATDALVFVCNTQKQYWRDALHMNHRNAHVIYNGIDTAFFAPREYDIHLPYAPDDFVIGMTAVFRPEKKHEYLVHAIARLRKEGIPAKGLLIGDGACRPVIEAAIREEKMEDHVTITGFMKDVRPYVSHCHVIVLCSIAIETFSIAVLEATAMGKPVVITRMGGAAEQVFPNENGFLYDAGDIDQLTSCLRDVWRADRGAEMGKTAMRITNDKFTETEMVTSYEDLFADILGKNVG